MTFFSNEGVMEEITKQLTGNSEVKECVETPAKNVEEVYKKDTKKLQKAMKNEKKQQSANAGKKKVAVKRCQSATKQNVKKKPKMASSKEKKSKKSKKKDVKKKRIKSSSDSSSDGSESSGSSSSGSTSSSESESCSSSCE